VNIAAQRVVLEPTARIEGDLKYQSAEPIVMRPGSVVTGAVQFTPLQQVQPAAGSGIVLNLIFSIGLILLALLLSRFAPRNLETVADTFKARPWENFGMGLLSLISVPPIAVLLAITLIGFPLALLSMIVWGLALFLSRIIVGFSLAR